MSECERHQSKLEAYLADELTEGDASGALAHAKICAGCGSRIALHRRLRALGDSVSSPSAPALDRMQARVVRRVSRRRTRTPNWASRWSWAVPPSLRVTVMIAAGLLLFLGGRWTATSRTTHGSADLSHSLVNAIGAAAVANRGIEDVEASRFIWSNVSMRRTTASNVALDFDLTTHVQVVEPIDSPIFQEALAQSLLNPASTGSRLNALRFVEGNTTTKVRGALVFALRHDESLAVRLEALSLLADQTAQPEVEAAIFETVTKDDAVQMRLLALDCLARHRIDPERIRALIREGSRAGDEALLVRLAQFEKGI